MAEIEELRIELAKVHRIMAETTDLHVWEEMKQREAEINKMLER